MRGGPCDSEKSALRLFGGPGQFETTGHPMCVFRWALVAHHLGLLQFRMDLEREWGGEQFFMGLGEANERDCEEIFLKGIALKYL